MLNSDSGYPCHSPTEPSLGTFLRQAKALPRPGASRQAVEPNLVTWQSLLVSCGSAREWQQAAAADPLHFGYMAAPSPMKT